MKPNRHFLYLVANTQPALVRNDTMEDRSFTVVPSVMMVEGVHIGSIGPILYSAEELAKLPVGWNAKPVVVYHPVENGVPVTACSPREMTARKVGVIMNSRYDGGLKAEAWIEPDRAQKVDVRVMQAVANKQMMEVSLGVWMDLEMTSGVWNGPGGEEPYIAIAHNLVGDHLAILPDMIGACSIADGAGFVRNQAGSVHNMELVVNGQDIAPEMIQLEQRPVSEMDVSSMRSIWISQKRGIRAIIGNVKATDPNQFKLVIHKFVFDKKVWNEANAKDWAGKMAVLCMSQIVLNEMEHDLIRHLLYGVIQDAYGDQVWIDAVYDSFVVMEDNGQLYKQTYTKTDGSVELVGDREAVVKVVEYRLPNGAFVGNNADPSKEKGIMMDKKKVVEALIANDKTPWTQADSERLLAMSEAQLAHLTEAAKPATSPAPAAGTSPATAQNGETPVATVPVVQNGGASAPKPVTLVEYIATLPKEMASVVQNALASVERERKTFVDMIMASNRNQFTREFLMTKDPSELRGIAALVVDATQTEPVAMYAGQQQTPFIGANQGADETEPLLVPTFADLAAAAL